MSGGCNLESHKARTSRVAFSVLFSPREGSLRSAAGPPTAPKTSPTGVNGVKFSSRISIRISVRARVKVFELGCFWSDILDQNLST